MDYLYKSNMRRACFACTTPYQIMNAISIVSSKNLYADIYIFDTFKGYNDLAYRLIKESIFHNVYTDDFYSTLKFKKCNTLVRLQCVLRFIMANKYFKHIITKSTYYSCFYSSSQAIPKMVLKRALDKSNPIIETVVFEDGVGTYFYGGRAFTGSSKFKYLQKLVKFEFLPDERTTFMPRFPEIAPKLKDIQNYQVIPIPPISNNDIITKQYERIFLGDVNLSKINERIIIFDDYRFEYSSKEKKLDEIYNSIVEDIGDDVICKPHPRSTGEIKSSIKVYTMHDVPVEILYMGMGNELNNKIIISVFSTAAFTPLLMFGKNPIIIFLYKMFLRDDRIKRCDQLLDKIKQVSKGVICTPDNINDFNKCLKALYN